MGRKKSFPRTNLPSASPAPAADTITFEHPLNGRLKGEIGQAFERFVELPVPLALTVMWFAGAAIIGLGGLAFYSFWLLLGRVAGA